MIICEVCKTNQRYKKVWEKFGKRVICMMCGQRYAFAKDGSAVLRTHLTPVAVDGAGSTDIEASADSDRAATEL